MFARRIYFSHSSCLNQFNPFILSSLRVVDRTIYNSVRLFFCMGTDLEKSFYGRQFFSTPYFSVKEKLGPLYFSHPLNYIFSKLDFWNPSNESIEKQLNFPWKIQTHNSMGTQPKKWPTLGNCPQISWYLSVWCFEKRPLVCKIRTFNVSFSFFFSTYFVKNVSWCGSTENGRAPCAGLK